MVKIGILKEGEGENRVACNPDAVKTLIKRKATVIVERGAGISASFYDGEYTEAGAQIMSREEVIDQADLILCIDIPSKSVRKRAGNKTWVGSFQAMNHLSDLLDWSTENGLVFSLDMLPRTTRAQSMDILSSQANIAGYKAVLLAANIYPRYFPMLTTAAGSIPPAKVLVLGAGVAGLQAIATARRLGAVVFAFDTRPVVKEQVMSLGGKFVEVDGAADSSQAGGYAVEQSEEFKQRQKAKIAEFAAKSDVIITTAQLRGKRAPILITKEMIQAMRPGSVIIDLASSTGGNTEATQDNQMILESGVAIIGNSNLPSEMPADASKVLGKNYTNFVELLIDKEGNLQPNFEDELVAKSCVCKDGALSSDQVKSLLVQI